jgi:hypothetical protein
MYASAPGDTLWKNNDQFDKPGPALAGIRKTLIAFAERSDLSSAEDAWGSMRSASSVNGMRTWAESSKLRHRRSVKPSCASLSERKKQGELGSDEDLEGMADFFDCTLAGIRAAAKAGKSRKALRNIAIFAGRATSNQDRAPASRPQNRENEPFSIWASFDVVRRSCGACVEVRVPMMSFVYGTQE